VKDEIRTRAGDVRGSNRDVQHERIDLPVVRNPRPGVVVELEHDRVVRLLQVRWRKRYQVATNRGGEQNEAVGTGSAALFPDLILSSRERGRRIQAVLEVDTKASSSLPAMRSTEKSLRGIGVCSQIAAQASLGTRLAKNPMPARRLSSSWQSPR
jgi:hypothetical protein